MTGRRCLLGVLAILAGLGWWARAAGAADPVRAVIVTGGHGYDRKSFAKACEGHDDIAVEVRTDKDPSAIFETVDEWKWDVIVLYNMSQAISEKQKANFLALLERGVGLVVWHHALANYQDWPEFERIAGGKYWLKDGERNGVPVAKSGYQHGVDLTMHVEDPNHPITRGMLDFAIHDETYHGQTFVPGIRVLVSTDHPKSDRPIAWVSPYRKGRVFAYQGGHDAKAWTNPGHRRLLAQGIRWAAGRLREEDESAPGTGADSRQPRKGL